MKKYFLACLLIVFTMLLFAQTAKEEALSSLDSAKSLIQQNNYQKAQEEINFALSKISEIQSEELVKFIPDAPAGFKLEDKKGQGLGQMGGFMGSSNAVTATATYRNDADASINLTISEGGMLGKTAGLAAMFGGGSGGTNGKSIRVNGYTGTSEFDVDNKSGKINLQIGEKISVMLEGNGIDNIEILKTLAGKMDLAKLEKAF